MSDATTQLDLNACRIGAVACVADLARARAFYEDTLGLRPEQVMEEHAVLYRCGAASTLTVYASQRNAGKAVATVAGFDVPDVEAAVASLSARGVAFERYDQADVQTDDRGIFDAGEFKSAWFRDPDGNTFALVGP